MKQETILRDISGMAAVSPAWRPYAGNGERREAAIGSTTGLQLRDLKRRSYGESDRQTACPISLQGHS